MHDKIFPRLNRLAGAAVCLTLLWGLAPAAAARQQAIQWVQGVPGEPLDRRAVAVGTMPDGLPSFVCVAAYKGGLHPGMTGVWIDGCSIGHGGREVTVKAYDVMVGSGNWARAEGGNAPTDAMAVGNEANGPALYVCRAQYQGGMFAGKTRPGFNGCNIGDQGEEKTVRTYEVLVSAPAAPAQPRSGATPNLYDNSGSWAVESWTEGANAHMCSATIANPSAQPDFGSFLRIENDGRQWALASDYLISGNYADVNLLIDGNAFLVRFQLEGDVARAPVDQAVVDALAAGRRINLNFDPSGQNFSLRGSQAALAMVGACVRGHGLENAGKPGVNDYNGYDIAGAPEAQENPYATVRGWTVTAATIGGNFAYCVGENDDRGAIWRLGWDELQWQAALPVESAPDWQGYLDVDGDNRPISGSARNGWTLLWLGRPELEKIGAGNNMIVDLGRASVRRALVGAAAVITKIEECVARKGQGGRAAAAPRPAPQASPARQTAAAGCPDDGPRLPFTGICAGRAVNYLTGASTYGDYLPDPSCDWVVNEVQVVEDALLYRALRCKGVTAELEFAGGAQWAQLMVRRSALNAAYGDNPNVADPKPLVWFNAIDPRNVERDLDMRARQGADNLGGRSCAIQRADPATSPDGYVFNITPADPQYAQSRQEPTPPLCGSFSEGDGVVRFWRVLGDYAFLFDLSADIYQDIDPNTLTLLKRDAAGGWAAVQ